MTTHKTKHIHVVAATIHVALEYDPNDLAQLTALNAQVRDAARQLTGFRDIEVRLSKIPAPVPETGGVQDGPLTPPPGLRR